jgi:hypothetical protein
VEKYRQRNSKMLKSGVYIVRKDNNSRGGKSGEGGGCYEILLDSLPTDKRQRYYQRYAQVTKEERRKLGGPYQVRDGAPLNLAELEALVAGKSSGRMLRKLSNKPGLSGNFFS